MHSVVLFCGILIGIGVGAKLWHQSFRQHQIQTISERLWILGLLHNSQKNKCIREIERDLEDTVRELLRDGVDIPENIEEPKGDAYFLSLARAYFEMSAVEGERTDVLQRLQIVPVPKVLDVSDIVGRSLPPVTLRSSTGELLDISELQGLVLVDFWASWCGHCWNTAHVLDDVKQWAIEQNIPVTVLSVNYGEDEKKAKDTQVKMKIKSPVYLDFDLKFSNGCNVHPLPTFLVANHGKIVAAKIGTLGSIEQWFIGEIHKIISDDK